MTSLAYILHDDEHGRLSGFEFGSNSSVLQNWTTANDDGYFNRTLFFPGFARITPGLSGWFSFTFNGTGVALYGNTGSGIERQGFMVQIDDNSAYASSTSDPTPQTWMQWYQSPELPAGVHKLNISGLLGTALDYIRVTPAQDTPILGETLIIDDANPAIQYHGSGWKVVNDQKFPGPLPTRPFQNATHQTSQVGDGFKFSFAGTGLRLYGKLQPGSVALSHSVDGGAAFQRSHDFETKSDSMNYLFVDLGQLPAGEHTLEVNVTSASGQPFVFDSIVYEPSFPTLLDMPKFAESPSPSTSISSPDSTASAVPPSSSKTAPIGAIAGGAIGGVIALIILIILFIFLRRRGKKDKQTPQFVEPDSSMLSPFPPQGHRPRLTAGIIEPYTNDRYPTHAYPTQANYTLQRSYHTPAATYPTHVTSPSEDFGGSRTGTTRSIKSDMTQQESNFPASATSHSSHGQMARSMSFASRATSESHHPAGEDPSRYSSALLARSPTTVRENEALRQQIANLREQNAHLERVANNAVPPPAYGI